jgi:hypothetical protein
MYQSTFGKRNQVQFNDEHEYYELLGFLAKSDRNTQIVLEHNEEQGAWEKEWRLRFYSENRPYSAILSHTIGTGNVCSRVNCNEFVENIVENHSFVEGFIQSIEAIRATIPSEYLEDFENGLNL